MEGKKVSVSRVTVHHQVLPHQTNNAGKMHGGELLRLLDSAGAICAFRHARGTLVTAAIEHMEFIAPISPGDIVMFHCSVNAVRRTSMEVGVRIEAEEYLTGRVRHVSTGYLTFVGIDDDGRPRALPPLIAENDEDRRRMNDAARRMAISRMSRQEMCNGDCAAALIEMDGTFTFCHMPCGGTLPAVPVEKLFGMVRSDDALFCVFKSQDMQGVDTSVFSQTEAGFVGLCFAEPGSAETVGVVASISAVLAASRVSVFVLSTMRTNFVFFPGEQREQALLALAAVGHVISVPR